MPEGPLGIPRPFLSEQALIGITAWDREITEQQASKGDLPVRKTNIVPGDLTNIIFDLDRVELDEINRFSSTLNLDRSKSMVDSSNIIAGRGPGLLFEETMLDSRLSVIIDDPDITERDVSGTLGELTEQLSIARVADRVIFTTHVVFIAFANDAREQLGIRENQMVFAAGIIETEDEVFESI